MFNYKVVSCDIHECTDYEERGMRSSLRDSKDTPIISHFEGVSYYDSKPISKNVPFIVLEDHFYGLCIPQEKFNFLTKLFINYCIAFNRCISIDNKRFFGTDPDRIGDKFVKIPHEN